MITLVGRPKQLGHLYGDAVASGILSNLSALIRGGHAKPLPLDNAEFRSFVKSQEDLLVEQWPWLLEEMAGIAESAGVHYQEILLLNLRAWQWEHYGACSSLAITLENGTVAYAGALDDPMEYYCGPVRFAPDGGHSFITFPITGTIWGNHGLNSAGLAVGISSQILPGLKRDPRAMNQDLAVRIILQTCSRVDEARAFCQEHPFAMNLVCVDAQGGMFCAHQTAAGLVELPANGSCALTNHVVDEHRDWFRQHGVMEFPESSTSRPRRGKLLRFSHERSGRCDGQEIRDFIGTRDDSDPGSIHNQGTAYMAYANPQGEPGRLWVMEAGKRWERLSV